MKTIIIDGVEYNLTQKVAFREGDWVVSPNGVYWHVDKISNNRYEVTSNTGESSNWNLDTNIYHKFDIQDAKEGDVLVASDGSIFLFKGTIGCACKHYVALTTDDVVKFNEGLKHYWEDSRGVHPATKEQRDLLFQKMKEAGYEWDAEKKELKKIVQNPAWSEEEVEIIDWLVSSFDCLKIPTNTFYQSKVRPFLISLRNKIQPIINEWSEEDGKEVAVLEAYIRSKDWSERHVDRALGIVDELVNKVKSLRPQKQWKPSDEQMEALHYVTNFDYGGHKAMLVSLYEQLKKLREE